MFGPRVLGDSLSPKSRGFAGGVIRGSGGDFVGVQRTLLGGTTAAAARRTGEFIAVPAPGARTPPQPPMAEPPSPPWGTQPRGPEDETPRPDQWLRAPVPDEARNSAPAAELAGPIIRARPMPGVVIAAPTSVARASAFAAATPAQSAAKALIRSGHLAKRSTVRITMDDEVAVLRGQVASEADRRLAEAAVRMEPGIWQVRNELEVKASAAVSR